MGLTIKHLPRANQKIVDFIAGFLRYPTMDRMTARKVRNNIYCSIIF